MLLLLNLVIAIMSDTFAKLTDLKDGLFSQGIVQAIPSYKNNTHYGGLIVAFPPFNLLTMLFLPIMLCYKDKDKLKKFNNRLCRSAYFPICFISAMLFTISNFLMIPLAFVKTLVHKFELWKNHNW